MGKIIKALITLSLCISSFVYAENEQGEKGKATSLEFNEVTAMFGNNLTPEPGILQDLLLAVGVDHTASNVPVETREIGIPFIMSRGIKYWASRLTKNARLDVIVNNALYLLYSSNRTEETEATALGLMRLAAQKNYWPAKFYVAEHNLKKYLTAKYDINSSKKMAINDDKIKGIANLTMEYYNDCARRGFALCQYRVGTWLITMEERVKDGLLALESSINISIKDTRYRGMFSTRRIHAALIIASLGSEHDFSPEKIKMFQRMVANATKTEANKNTLK